MLFKSIVRSLQIIESVSGTGLKSPTVAVTVALSAGQAPLPGNWYWKILIPGVKGPVNVAAVELNTPPVPLIRDQTPPV